MLIRKLSAILIIVTLISLFSGELIWAVEKPLSPVVYAGSKGRYELYWFYPGLHRTNLGNLRDAVIHNSCPGDEDKQYAVFTRFAITPPVWIDSISTYIANADSFPELPGDQYTAIRLSLKQRISQANYSELWSGNAKLGPIQGAPGMIISCPVGLSIDNSDEVWTVQEWLPGFPTAPLIGQAMWSGDWKQDICSMRDSTYQFQECLEEYMIGLELLGWTGGNYNSGIKFRIQFTPDISDLDSLTLGNIDSDSLHYAIDRVGGGYARIIAIAGGIEESSNLIHLDSARLPRLSADPQKLECRFLRDTTSYSSFQISNAEQYTVYLRLYYDSSLFLLDKDSVRLSANQKEIIGLTFSPPPSGSIFSSDILVCGDADHYPLVYHIIFREDKKLDANGETHEILPGAFAIGEPYPNPFNGSVRFEILNGMINDLKMEVYNILGQRVYSSVKNIRKGEYLVWDGRDQMGTETPSGIYFFRFASNDRVILRRGIYLK